LLFAVVGVIRSIKGNIPGEFGAKGDFRRRRVVCRAWLAAAFAQAFSAERSLAKGGIGCRLAGRQAAGAAGPKDVSLIDQATLKLPAGYFFVPQAEGARVLRALGNVVNDASSSALSSARAE
jgi:uncharacterized membrane-anchored protein